MKVLHTSDWHLGKTLYGRRCYREFASFLDWLAAEIERQQADCLLISGDIYDTTTPAATVQSLYYSFLHSVSKGCCRHVVIIGGNHDSSSLLNAPRQLLKYLNVTVIGAMTSDPRDEVLTLHDPSGNVEMIVCAVPYLRDRDVRLSEAGESIEDKATKLVRGIADHYKEVTDIALEIQKTHGSEIPIVAMGHLYAAGGKVADNNEVRDLYIGTLAHVHASIFPDCIDYLALGHLHIAQNIDSSSTRRYCGSPLQLSFGKGNSNKSITTVSFSDTIAVDTIDVPPFLRLHTIHGDHESIFAEIEDLLSTQQSILLEVHNTGLAVASLHQEIEEILNGSEIELIRVVNDRFVQQTLAQEYRSDTLEELSEIEVFRKCLESHDIPEADRDELVFCFKEILMNIAEEQESEAAK